MDLVTAFLTILFVMDPLGNVPIFLSVLKDVPEQRRMRVILSASPLLFRVLGRRGLIATERLMGMLLVIISVQMFFDGIDRFLAGT